MQMIVDKHHALRFAAGRRIPMMQMPDGAIFVHVIEGGGASTVGLMGAASEGALAVPEGCRLGEVALEDDWVMRLPNPTRALFFASGDSFQGPIESLPGKWKEIA